jgi:hypothetical protein
VASTKTPFLITFITTYILISLPAMLGIGYIIDWIPEATLLQKFKAYVVGGLAEKFVMKIIVSLIVGVIVSLVVPTKRKLSQNNNK